MYGSFPATGRALLAFLPLLLLTPSARSDDGDLTFEALKQKFEDEKSREVYLRVATVEAFGKVPSPETTKFLISLIKTEKNPAMHATIARALGKQGNTEAVQALVTQLVPMLQDDLLHFPHVAEALRQPMDRKAESFLMRQALSPKLRSHPEVFAAMIQAVANLENVRRFSLLSRELKSSRDPKVQLVILEAYREHRPRTAAKDVAGLLKASNPEVQAAALEVLLVTEAKTRTYQKLYTKLLRAPFWKTRVLAVDCLAMVEHPDRLELLVPLLADSHPTVQIAAVDALVRLEAREVIPHLIEAVDRTEGRVQDDVIDALIRLTGVNMGYSSAQWDSWWAQYKGKVEVRRRDQEEFREVRIQENKDSGTLLYHGIRVLSNKAAFVIDCSESMKERYRFRSIESEESGGSSAEKRRTGVKDPRKKRQDEDEDAFTAPKIEVAKSELAKVLKSLKNGVLINIIRFDTHVAPWREKLQELTAELREDVQKFVAAANPGGLTNVYDALELAFRDERLDTIYLLSDGAPTHGQHRETPAILAAVAELNRVRKVKINTIGFNLKPHEEELLKQLADANHGVFISR